MNVHIDIRFDHELHRYVCHELTLTRLPGEPPITTELLRSIAIEKLIIDQMKAHDLWPAAS